MIGDIYDRNITDLSPLNFVRNCSNGKPDGEIIYDKLNIIKHLLCDILIHSDTVDINHINVSGTINNISSSVAKITDIISLKKTKYKQLPVDDIKVEQHRSIVVDGMRFTGGPSIFVDSRDRMTKSKNAKRCIYDKCSNSLCDYYHDPLIHNTTCNIRYFSISYIIFILNNIKTDKDIIGNTNIHNIDFLRDIVQLSDSIMRKSISLKKILIN